MNITQSITLDFGRDTTPITVFAKQNDSKTRFIRIAPLENGKPLTLESGLTARLHLTKADGHTVINDATINVSDGTITAEFTRQALAAAGTAIAEIGLYKDEALLSSQTFFVNVEKNAYQSGIPESSDEYKSFAAALGEVDTAIEKTEQAAQNANAKAAAADAATAAANSAADAANAIVQEHFDFSFFINERGGLSVKILKEGYENADII